MHGLDPSIHGLESKPWIGLGVKPIFKKMFLSFQIYLIIYFNWTSVLYTFIHSIWTLFWIKTLQCLLLVFVV